jgi:hypothetical protein
MTTRVIDQPLAFLADLSPLHLPSHIIDSHRELAVCIAACTALYALQIVYLSLL